MIVYRTHPRTNAERVMSMPLTKKEHDLYLTFVRTGEGRRPPQLTQDEVSFFETGLTHNGG